MFNSVSMINFQWLEELVSRFPEVPVVRKNLLGIAGFPDWEQVNSNLLAFYLNPEEEHQLSDLFLQSLLDEVESKSKPEHGFDREIFAAWSSLFIKREFTTIAGNRIDLVIENRNEEEETMGGVNQSQWAILIENKVENAVLEKIPNDLDDYWVSVPSQNKLGVVLTLFGIKDKSNLNTKTCRYIHITHGDLSKRIKNNLSEYFEDSDDRHLLFLKEYLANIASFYNNDFQKSPGMEDTLKLFQQHRDQILDLKKMDEKVLQFVSQNLFKVMGQYGYEPYSKDDKSKGKHFYPSPSFYRDKDFNPDGVRFWVWMDGLRYYNTFEAYWELYSKENTRFGPVLREYVDGLKVYSKSIIKGKRGHDKGEYCHLFHFKLEVPWVDSKSFEECLDGTISNFIFKHPANYIRAISQKLAEIRNGANPSIDNPKLKESETK